MYPDIISAYNIDMPCRVYRSPSLASACATALRNQSIVPGSDDSAAATESRAVDARDAVYMLNPSGDLPHTQETFQDFFRQQTGWQVTQQSTHVHRQYSQPYSLVAAVSLKHGRRMARQGLEMQLSWARHNRRCRLRLPYGHDTTQSTDWDQKRSVRRGCRGLRC